MENKKNPHKKPQAEPIDSRLSHPSKDVEILEKEVFERRLYEYLSSIIPDISAVQVKEARPWAKKRIKVVLKFDDEQDDFVEVDIQQSLLYIWKFKLVIPDEIKNDEGYLKNVLKRAAV